MGFCARWLLLRKHKILNYAFYKFQLKSFEIGVFNIFSKPIIIGLVRTGYQLHWISTIIYSRWFGRNIDVHNWNIFTMLVPISMDSGQIALQILLNGWCCQGNVRFFNRAWQPRLSRGVAPVWMLWNFVRKEGLSYLGQLKTKRLITPWPTRSRWALYFNYVVRQLE